MKKPVRAAVRKSGSKAAIGRGAKTGTAAMVALRHFLTQETKKLSSGAREVLERAEKELGALLHQERGSAKGRAKKRT